MIIVAIVGFTVNFLSTFAMWNYVRIAHNSGGIWSNLNPTLGDAIMTFTPVLNTFAAVLSWMRSPRLYNERRPFNKLFCIRK